MNVERLSRGLVCMGSLIMLASCLMGQSAGTAGLTGLVSDPTGAVIPNATVSASNTETNQARTTSTGADGVYKFALLPPGTYRVRFNAMGFKSVEVPSVTLNVTENPVLNQSLEVGAQSEQITVAAVAEILQTTSSTLGTTVSAGTVTELPLASRNYTQILGLSSGVSLGANNAVSFGKGTLDMSVNGNDPGQNNFQMDGVAINNMSNNGSSNDAVSWGGIAIPSPDSIQEFKVQTSTYDASYGRNAGGNVNVVTKSGTNSWHGTAFEFLRNAQLDANDFFYNRDVCRTTYAGQSCPKQVLNQNQFGGVIGGPIKKDKLFIFGSYEGTRSRNGVAPQGNLSGVLLPAIPNGDRTSAAFVSQLIAGNCGSASFGPTLSCSATTVSPQSLAILQLKNADGSYYIPSDNGVATQTSFSVPAIFREDQMNLNGDYIINSKNTLTARYFYSHDPRTVALPAVVSGNLPGDSEVDTFTNHNAVLRLTTILTNTLVNEARASYQRFGSKSVDEYPPGSSLQSLRITPLEPGQTAPPPISFLDNGFSIFGTLQAPSYSPANQEQIADQISWSRGKHTMRTGFELEKAQYPSIQGGLSRGPLLFGSFTDLLVGGPGSVDACSNCTRTASGEIVHGYLESNVSAYFQDDWKVNTRLTVNMGVRWEYDGTFSDKYGSLSNTWLSQLVPNSQVLSGPNLGPANFGGWVVPSNYLAHYPQPPAGVLINPSGNGALRDHPPLSNFGPRLGFAYQLTSKLVVRGGAGIFYDRVGAGLFFHSVEQGNPYAESTVYAPPANATYTLADPYPAQPFAGTFAQRWANLATGQTSALSLPFYNEDSHTPLVRQYNLTFQYEFAPRWVLEAGYVGSNAINLVDSGHNYNTAFIATPTDPINGITTTTVANAPLRVPYLGYQAAGLQGSAYDGVSSYNSLQVSVRKQLAYGLSLQGSYTWSKSLTDLFNSVANSNDASNLAQQYGPSNFNRPQRFILNYSWALPFGKHNGFTGKLLGGWNLSGVTTIQDGTLVSLIDNRGGTAYGVSGTSASGGYSRAQLCPGETYGDIATSGGVESRLGGNSGGSGYFNKAAFCTPPAFNSDGSLTTAAACPKCAIGYGNTGAGILMGPGQFNFDAALLKTTNVTERQSVQFRAEFFNLFNHPQFNGPAQVLLGTQGLPNVNSPTGSWITSTSVNPRVIQIGLKYIF